MLVARERPTTPSRVPRILPKVILFDMDDTIFDHSLTCRDALGQVRRNYRVLRGRSIEETWGEYERLLEVTHTDVMLGRRTSDDVRSARFQSLAKWAGQPIDRDTAVELSRTYRVCYQRLRRPVSGAPEFVRGLRGRTRIGIVTNNTVTEQREKLVFLGLERAVDFLVTSEEVGAAKPDPAIFRTALERAEALPREAVMVGDGWSTDVCGAQAVGIRAVWFNRFLAPRPDLAVPQFTSFRAPRRLEELLAGTAVSSPEV